MLAARFASSLPLLLVFTAAGSAFADEPEPAPASTPAPPVSSAPASSARASVAPSPPPATAFVPLPRPKTPTGVAVVALGNSSDATWSLAQSVYGRSKLRPQHLTETEVRVLAGEPVAVGAPPVLVSLAADRANLGADPSTADLVSLGTSLGVSALYLVLATPSKVRGYPDKVRARLFVVSSRTFGDAESPQEGRIDPWSTAVASAEQKLVEKPSSGKPFYASPFFWSALGAAAALGGVAIALAATKNEATITFRGEVVR